MKKTTWHWVSGATLAIVLAMPAAAELSGAGGAMIAVNAARAVKKHKEKAEQEQAQANKLAKLQERYPKDVAEYQSLLKSDPDAARRKMKAMVRKYQDDTGVDLDELYYVKPKEGPIKKLRERLTEGDKTTTAPAPVTVTPTATPTATPAPASTTTTAAAATTEAAKPAAATTTATATTPAKPHRGLLRDLIGDLRGEIKEGRKELADEIEGKPAPAK